VFLLGISQRATENNKSRQNTPKNSNVLTWAGKASRLQKQSSRQKPLLWFVEFFKGTIFFLFEVFWL